MAIQFPDLSPAGPTPLSNTKQEQIKVVRLLAADIALAGATASVKAVLPADASITGFDFWKKTAFSGGGVTAATLSIGVPGTPTQFVTAFDINTPAAGSFGVITPVANIMQPYNLPLGPDIALFFTGTATTGAPTAGEIYITIRYVR